MKPNLVIYDSQIKARNVIDRYLSVACSISGGSDSDIVLDLCAKADPEHRIHYIWFDTGLEYNATKAHLDFLEQKYDIRIERIKAVKPIPISCRTFGQPFLSKQVSEMMKRLQRHNFQWRDMPYERLVKAYPHCRNALRWWCNAGDHGSRSRFNINNNKWLKEFIIANPPTFRISNACCHYAKKKVSQQYIRDNQIGLMITGIRKAEGGIRSVAYKSCFSVDSDGCDQYRPIFWYSSADKELYERLYGITHSACYTQYGLSRTGCVGCPFGRGLDVELSAARQHEPGLYRAVTEVFKDSYAYTQAYRAFCEQREKALRKA